jgi:hypothetical protein
MMTSPKALSAVAEMEKLSDPRRSDALPQYSPVQSPRRAAIEAASLWRVTGVRMVLAGGDGGERQRSEDASHSDLRVRRRATAMVAGAWSGWQQRLAAATTVLAAEVEVDLAPGRRRGTARCHKASTWNQSGLVARWRAQGRRGPS